MSLFRVNLDGKANTTHYTQSPDITENGHLKFTDMDGRERMYAWSHRWTVVEVTDDMIANSPHLQALTEDAEVIA